MSKTIEFAKHFQAHLGAINAMVLSPDGLKLVTTSQDKMIKFFEVTTFDMVNMISAGFTPTAACWLLGGNEVAVADAASGAIFLFRSSDGSQRPSQELKIHTSPVVAMALSCCGIVVSGDQRGMIEYWDSATLDFPAEKVAFQMKTETDLYDLAKARTVPCSIAFSPDGETFAVLSRDKQIRLFDLRYLEFKINICHSRITIFYKIVTEKGSFGENTTSRLQLTAHRSPKAIPSRQAAEWLSRRIWRRRQRLCSLEISYSTSLEIF